MTDYTLGPPVYEPGAETVTGRHFGVNVVTIYDQEIADPGGVMQTLVSELGAQTLRFPGGTATELYFDMTDPDSAVSAVPGTPALTPLDQFMAAAGQIGCNVALVVPTRVAFADPAADAMLAGSYGSRSTLDPDYLDDVEAYVRGAIADAVAAGTQIVTLEIGNEFWNGGQMTASEYGYIAGLVAVRLQAVLDDLALPDVQIVAQATSSASQIFSPRYDTEVYITADGEVHGTPPAEAYQTVTVSGQGSAGDQLDAITDAINAIAGAADAIDGAVLHFYQREGFAGVDGGRDFTFSQLDAFATQLLRSTGAPDLARHITEWNAAAGNSPNNAGLQQAAMIVETFHEMLTNGVTDAQIWPLSFNNAQGTSLTDLGDARLSIAGEMFRLMQASLPGLTPALDWSVAGEIDIHGYTGAERTALFLSERSGAAQTGFDLDVGTMLTGGTKHFVTMTALWDGGAGGSSAGAAPVIAETDGVVVTGSTLEVSLDAWANMRIEMTLVDWTDNIVHGRGGHDRIYTYNGNDEVRAGDGHDYVDGGAGDDIILGGGGNDWLKGDEGQDVLTGGAGSDVFLFDTGDDADVVTDLDFSEDRLRINGVYAASTAELEAMSGVTLANDGGDLLASYGAGDQVRLVGHAVMSARALGGRQVGTDNGDTLTGTGFQDDLRGRGGNDTLTDGSGRDFLRGGDGADTFVLVRDGQRDRITDFMPGTDKIDLSAWGAGGFEDLSFEAGEEVVNGWSGLGYLHWQDEVLYFDGLDAATMATISADDFIF